MSESVSLAPGAYRPLTGIRVLEVSGHVAGGYCGRLLSQLGAIVTRVDTEWSAYVQPAVRSAFRAALDEGKSLVTPEALRAGAFDFDAAVFDSLDDDRGVEGLRELSQSLLARCPSSTRVVEVTDFGPVDTDSPWPGSDIAAAAWAGMTWATGAPGREPLSLPGDFAEFVAGCHAAALVVMSLLDEPDGTISTVALTDVLGYVTAMIVNNFIPYGRPWHRDGPRATQSGGCYPGSIFEASDGPIMIMCRQQSEWDGLVRAMGSPAWAADERFRDPREIARLHAVEADGHLVPWIRGLSKEQLRAVGQDFGFPTAPVRSVGEALSDPQFAFREFLRSEGGIVTPGTPWRVRQPAEQISSAAGAGAPNASDPGAAPRRSTPALPLSGVRVLDFSWVWSGPMVTSILGDLGAEVIKVENPKRPDPARARGPARRDGEAVEGPPLELSPYFNQLGHGKKSIVVDLASDEGRQAILELAQSCDIVVENMRPGVLARLGLGYDRLREANPEIVMLSMSTVGQEGPASGMMGYGMVMSGLAGLESLVGYDDETMGMFNLAISDPVAGSHALVALFAALHAQRTRGESAWIDLSQTECTVSCLLEQILEFQVTGIIAVPQNSHTDFSPHGVYRARGEDSWIAVAVRNDDERRRLASLLGDAGHTPDLDPDPVPDLEDALSSWAGDRIAGDAAAQLRAIGVSASVVMPFEALVDDGWYLRRGFSRSLPHPALGDQVIAAAPWELRGHRLEPTTASPLMGEHTVDVLRRILGYTDHQVAELITSGVVSGSPRDGRSPEHDYKEVAHDRTRHPAGSS